MNHRGTATASVVGIISILSACSSPAPRAAPAPGPTNLAGTSWIGQCSAMSVGTYGFDFGRGDGAGGMVTVTGPDIPEAGNSVPYVLQAATGSRGPTFTFDLDPPWRGGMELDRADLTLDFVIGNRPGGHRCDLAASGRQGSTP